MKEIAAILLIFAAMAAPPALITHAITSEYAVDAAIESGHAEYFLDADHKRQFRWKDCEHCSKEGE